LELSKGFRESLKDFASDAADKVKVTEWGQSTPLEMDLLFSRRIKILNI
jgi:hypothetical protein